MPGPDEINEAGALQTTARTTSAASADGKVTTAAHGARH